jgi:ABC-type branched-subunit amino acid transport system ATPase component
VFRIIGDLKRGVTVLLVEQFAAAALKVADYGYDAGKRCDLGSRRSRQAARRPLRYGGYLGSGRWSAD